MVVFKYLLRQKKKSQIHTGWSWDL